MIIPIIIYISCMGMRSSSTEKHISHQAELFSIDSIEQISSQSQTTQEKSQVSFLLGMKRFLMEDYILARAQGIQCLDEISRFSIMQVEKNPIPWSQISVRNKGLCNDETPSLLLSIPSSELSVACMTWTIASWSQLLQEYRIEKGVVNAKSLLVMTTWLEEHRQCLDSPWVRFAIATGLFYGSDPTEGESRKQEREKYALSLIESLWDHPEIQDYVRFWYIRHRVHNTSISAQEIAIWMASLQGKEREEKIPQVKQLRSILKSRRHDKTENVYRP